MSRDFERLRQKLDELKDCMVESSLAQLRCCNEAIFSIDEHGQDAFSSLDSIIWCKRDCPDHGEAADRIEIQKSAKRHKVVFQAHSRRGFK